MKKRCRSISCLLCLVLVLFCLPVSADAGPKPSVVVTLEGLEGQACWGTLLTPQLSTGPYSAADVLELSDGLEAGEREAWEQFFALSQEGDNNFLCYVDDCSDGIFRWTYYPPSDFQLALWFPDTKTLLVSQAEKRYAFDSYFTLSLEDVNLMGEITGVSLERSYDYAGELLGLLGRVALTVGVEVLAALAFGLWGRRQLQVILAANLATQGLLNLALNLFTYFCGALAGMTALFMGPVYLLAELLVVWVECRIYRKWLVEREGADRTRVILYTWLANLLSLLVGAALSFQLSGMF